MEASLMSSKQHHVVYYDILNIIACFGVVSMHANGLTHTFAPTLGWLQAFAVDCLFYWAVPVFFMLSGATLMNYRDRYDTRTFFMRRVVRTVIPFLAWSLIAILHSVLLGTLSLPIGPRTLINLVLNTQAENVYWFFIPLFSAYLSLPVLSCLAKRKRVLWYIAGVGFALNASAPFVSELVGISWNTSLSLPIVSGYLIYVVLGYLLSEQDLSHKQALVLYCLGIAGAGYRYVSTAILSFGAGELVHSGWNMTATPIVCESAAIFTLFKRVHWTKLFSINRATRVLHKLASCSFGIYLTHIFILEELISLLGLGYSSALLRIAGPFVIYALSLILVLMLKKVPLIRCIVP